MVTLAQDVIRNKRVEKVIMRHIGFISNHVKVSAAMSKHVLLGRASKHVIFDDFSCNVS